LKITREELDRTEDESVLDLFTQGIRAEATRKKYTRTLRKILCEVFEDVLEGDYETRAAQLVRMAKENPDWVKDLLLNLSKKLKQRTQLPKDHVEYLNPSSVESYFKPIKKLFDMNDVTISWKRINSTLPELDNISAGRGWTRQEIQKMLNFANGAMDRTIVLFAASSSIRSGAFELNWGDTEEYQDLSHTMVTLPEEEPTIELLEEFALKPEDIPQETIIGGNFLPINSSALLIAGVQSTIWIIPVVLSIVGISVLMASRKSG
jgi:hypothetical protein